ncbi:protein mono-ADP-ribosyltransferase PARP4-like isoform 3-T3 [Leptodactylus fuscus]|uniref:protein mono-ADP-ribosyltransferase PARP4-like isoform X3 n=1 Tax=Leptodactylus fuscus TaxID=238119 RepID=UPI003F4F0DDE
MGLGIFSDYVFFLKVNSLPLKEKTKLKKWITANGGEISFTLNEKCTHAVLSNSATLNSTQQKKIEKHNISVVNPDFIWNSVQEERLVEVEYKDNDKPCEDTRDEVQEEKKQLFLAKLLDVTKKDILERNLEEDLEFEDDGDNDNIPDDAEVAKYCCFQKDEEYAIVELLCFKNQDSFPFRVSTVRGFPNTFQKELTFHLTDSAEKACEKHEQRINDIKNQGFSQIYKIPLQAENLASKALQKVLLGEAINSTDLSPEVAGLVESIWVDSVGHLDSVLSRRVESISLNDLSKAEGILRQIRNALVKKDKGEDISQMMQEFYQCIPHKEKIYSNIDMKFLTVKQDLCQVIRDMVNFCESSLSGHIPTSTAKYQALRSRIEHIDPNSAEFHQVKQGILDNNHSNRQFNILRVFRVGRLSEATNFKSDLGNVKSLLHASSPCNFVGILSRGLMLPKMIVEEFGGERTDIGNLGSGIYFSDSISTSVKYSQASDVTGSRLLVICDVALGKCKDVFHRDYTITEPPNGFHSVHGVQRKHSVTSDFTDDEYVVYNVNQVQMRYIVQFSTDGDNVDLQKESLFISMDKTPDHSSSLAEPSEDVSIDDLPDDQATKGGLKGSDGQLIPLESIHVKAQLMDLAAKVVMFQTYKNNSTVPIEAKYVFPLDSTAAVCGFEAFINGKHIIGEVKEKQKAHREYRTAIREGHGAYLMDQDSPDVFTVSVGNLPSKATVVIKITYVMELTCRYNNISFNIPANVAHWLEDKSLKESTQDTVTKVGVEHDVGSFCLDMSIEMPRKINEILCYSHKIKIKKTECKAVVQTEESSHFNYLGFSLEVLMENAYVPRMWVEKHPDQDSEASMLIFQPEMQSDYEDTFLTICLDCSNSMESCFHSAKQVALLALHSAYSFYVNIVLFGSNSKEMYCFPKSHNYEYSDMERFIKGAKPTMGSTEFWKVLQSLCLLRPQKGCQKVLLISDGHVQNENLVFQILNDNKNHIQVFTCGVGPTANKHMLRCMAQYTSGAFEYFSDTSKSRWRDQMVKHGNRLHSPTCKAVSVKWRQFNQNSSEILQAPANIQALFSEESLFVYGFVPHCTQATLKALINNEELENMVSTTELQKTTGTILHTLTARALIKDYEDGILHEKENENEMKKQEMKSFIIQLSKEYSLVTQFTSFVAVEKRSAEETIDTEPNILEIVSAVNVDILPYMDWSSPDADRESISRESAEEIVYNDFLFCAVEEEEEASEDLPSPGVMGQIPMAGPDTAMLGFAPLRSSLLSSDFSFNQIRSNIVMEMPSSLEPQDDSPIPEAPAPPPSRDFGRAASLQFSRSALKGIKRRRVKNFERLEAEFDMPVPCSAIQSMEVEVESIPTAGPDKAMQIKACVIELGSRLAEKQSNIAIETPSTLELQDDSDLSDLNGIGYKKSSVAVRIEDSLDLVIRSSIEDVSEYSAQMLDVPRTIAERRYQYCISAPVRPRPIMERRFVIHPWSSFSSLQSQKRRFVPPPWSSLSSLQSQEGYWLLSRELGTLLKINVWYLTEDFLVKKGIRSLGTRGIDTIHKLIATLLVLQIIRVHNILSGIRWKTLMKLDQSIPKSSQYPSIEKAIEWAVKSDRQYPDICMRLGLGKDWDQATRQLLGLDPIPTTSDLYSILQSLFLS